MTVGSVVDEMAMPQERRRRQVDWAAAGQRGALGSHSGEGRPLRAGQRRGTPSTVSKPPGPGRSETHFIQRFNSTHLRERKVTFVIVEAIPGTIPHRKCLP